MSKSNIIEINGKQYDARSGALIESGSPQPREKASNASQHIQPHSTEPAKKTSKQAAIARQPAQHANRRLKASATLMRHAVRKPSDQPKLKAHGHIDTVAKKTHTTLAVKPSVQRMNHHRLAKAQAVDKSQLIQHFSPVTSDAAALAQPATASTHRAPHTAAPLPVDPSHHTTRRTPRTTSDVLEHALKHASSHEQSTPAHKRRNHKARRAGVGLAAALIVVVGGFTLSQNLPNIRMQMATARAGFHASLPSYQPPGFHLADVDYSDGVITSGFRSNSDDRSFRITQSPSQWTNTLLVDSFVTPTDIYYETVQHGAQTIYLYDNGSATWVNDGVWHVITSKGVLSNRQLIALATSF